MSAIKHYFRLLISRYFFIIGIAVFILALISSNSQNSEAQNEAIFNKIKNTGIIQGMVVTYPVLSGTEQSFVVNNSNPDFRVLIYLPRDQNVARGEVVTCATELKIASGSFYISRNIKAIAYECNKYSVISQPNALQQIFNSIRISISSFCHKELFEPQASLLTGMLIGSDEMFSENFDTALLITGTKHIISVSGFNVGFIAGLTLSLASLTGRKKAILITIPTLILYLFLVGEDNIPALRATIMAVYFLLGQLFGIKTDFFNSIGLALIIIILIAPLSVLSVSLYLSFAAVSGQAILDPLLKNIIKFRELRTSLVCILGTLPVTLLFFKEFYPWAFVANVLIAPLLPVIMDVAIISLPFAQLLNNDSRILLLAPLKSLLLVLVDIINAGNSLPLPAITLSWIEILIMVILILIALIIFLVLKIRNEKFQD